MINNDFWSCVDYLIIARGSKQKSDTIERITT